MASSQKYFTLITVFALIVGVFFCLGTIRYQVNPLSRSALLNQFIHDVQVRHSIDPQKFWEFRDQYGATNARFLKEELSREMPFLIYHTRMILSKDTLVKNKPSLIPPSSKYNEILFQSDNEIVYMENRNQIHIRFIKSEKDMEKVNGFPIYFGIDLTPYTQRLWYSDTTIYL